jgi:hypothetical protein
MATKSLKFWERIDEKIGILDNLVYSEILWHKTEIESPRFMSESETFWMKMESGCYKQQLTSTSMWWMLLLHCFVFILCNNNTYLYLIILLF